MTDGWWASAAALVDEMECAVRGAPVRQPSLDGLVMELVRSNLQQWDLEDATRDPDVSDAVVAGAKRSIDRLNLRRHNLVEEIDGFVADRLNLTATATLATESPGMILDRLSVMVIRRARTAATSSSQAGYADRIPVLDAQIAGLLDAFDTYMDELRAGTRRFLAHNHLKLYASRTDS